MSFSNEPEVTPSIRHPCSKSNLRYLWPDSKRIHASYVLMGFTCMHMYVRPLVCPPVNTDISMSTLLLKLINYLNFWSTHFPQMAYMPPYTTARYIFSWYRRYGRSQIHRQCYRTEQNRIIIYFSDTFIVHSHITGIYIYKHTS